MIELLDRRIFLTAAAGQIFVPDFNSNTVGQYDTSGAAINASLISGLDDPSGIAVSGGDVFVVSYDAGTIGEYTTAGSPVNPSLITGLQSPTGIAISGTHIFVAQYDYNNSVGFIGEYTITGSTVKASLISGLETPQGIAISGSDLFVADSGTDTIGEYTTSGATVNASLISGLQGPMGVAVSGSDLFVAQNYNGTVGEYTITGSTVNDSLLSGFDSPDGIAVQGSNLFVQDDDGTIGQYTTAGDTVNASLLNLDSPTGIAVVASPQEQSSPQLIFSQQPTNTTAGQPINPALIVTAEDANGNIVTDDKSKITLTISSGGKLIGTASEPLVNGIATFSKLSITTAGSYTLTASDNGYTSTVSSNFTINAAAAIKIAFKSQPGNVSAGTPFSEQVELFDKYGNLAGDGASVTLTLGSHPTGTNLGVTQVADNGEADFDAITLDTAGNYTLKASEGKLKITSKKFVIS